MRLTRAATNFLLDAVALVVLVGVLWTRIVAFWVVPERTGDAARVMLWGLDHRGWDQVNFWTTMGFAIVVLVHLILHWTWVSQFVHQRVKRFTGSKGVLDSGTQTVYGVGFMIAVFTIAGGLLAVAAVAAKAVP